MAHDDSRRGVSCGARMHSASDHIFSGVGVLTPGNAGDFVTYRVGRFEKYGRRNRRAPIIEHGADSAVPGIHFQHRDFWPPILRRCLYIADERHARRFRSGDSAAHIAYKAAIRAGRRLISNEGATCAANNWHR